MSGFGTPRLAEDGTIPFAVSDVVPDPPVSKRDPNVSRQPVACALRSDRFAPEPPGTAVDARLAR